ncbi:MAG TPA: hypothetical protein VLT87_23895 [Thermoanaerobaculia bacterium]|nr:hypothetical protein [Thermoanaerobaculia bacterium]
MRPRSKSLALAAGFLAAFALLVPTLGETGEDRVELTAVLETPSGDPPIPSGKITITLDRYSSEAERAAMKKALAEGGQKGLFKLLSKTRVGKLSRPGTPDVDILYASLDERSWGQQLSIVSERWEGFGSKGHPFNIAWVAVDCDHPGRQGAIVVGTEVHLGDKNTVWTHDGERDFWLENVALR